MMRVRFSELALADLEELAAYISQDSPVAAQRVINRIEELCEKLGAVPGMGRVSELPPARKFVVPPWRYKIIYEIDEAAQQVVILRVYHGARNMPY
ncbi:MAG: type II toxin-antitoxin system RelE/ParE family toxin [Hyphomicrobium sp.]|uniref:type II toxin-antitoxin system RelE/ParE family toxin n=1 Tax=Hyphomicrobium sp. TaxID=82 RepID=UPI00132151E9|nr:type II toxin-antitoxin system RelE/ParE family toxin [Hyphomicrobium sp.]KAB2938282.1 MAG: type II toxin-antitoxin system RelE/ParE family toxin [Hyphomicrobium sp.]MBZ0211265.1 type II toxin-antitoxin system RelE/ParE family toxin [Hyphomicrobium sp.]